MMFGNGYNGISHCLGFGNGFMHGGWGMMLMGTLVVLLTIGVILLAMRTGNRQNNNAAIRTLKMKLAKAN